MGEDAVAETGMAIEASTDKAYIPEEISEFSEKQPRKEDLPLIAAENGVVHMRHAGQLIVGWLKNYRVDMLVAGSGSTVSLSLDIHIDTLAAADSKRNKTLAEQMVRIMRKIHETKDVEKK